MRQFLVRSELRDSVVFGDETGAAAAAGSGVGVVRDLERRAHQLALIVNDGAAQQRQREGVDEQLGVVRGDDGVAGRHGVGQRECVLKAAASAAVHGDAQFEQRLLLALAQKPNLRCGAFCQSNGMCFR